MARTRALGALAAACARIGVAGLLVGVALLPAPALAAGHGSSHAAGHGKSAHAPGHIKPSRSVATNRGSVSGRLALAGPMFALGIASQPVPVPPEAAPGPAASPAPRPQPVPVGGTSLVAAPVGLRPALSARVEPPALAATSPAPTRPGLETFPPPVVLPPGAEGERVAVALFALPLLVAAWLWSLVKLGVSVWTHRGAGIRSALALQLGVPAEQLAGLDLAGLRRLRDGIAFDELTGVLRRAAGLASMERELARSARAEHPVTAVFIDVDGLKATNDALGHEAGDDLLRRVASVLRGRLRAQDLIFRYGGDEFVCVMPGTTRGRAERIIDDLRRSAAGDGLDFSWGAVQAARGETAADVIARADAQQYLDKESRRAGR